MSKFSYQIGLILTLIMGLYLSYQFVPTEWSTDVLIGFSFVIGIWAGILATLIIYNFKSYRDFRTYKSPEDENPIMGFAKKMGVGLFSVAVIMTLVTQHVLIKPVIDFEDGKFAMAKIHNITEITTHSGTKYQVEIQYKSDEDTKVNTYDTVFPLELKLIKDLDSIPIAFSASNPRNVSIISTDEKLKRIQEGR